MIVPHRPAVSVHVPREIRAGQPLEVITLVTAKRDVKVDAITARIRGYEQIQAVQRTLIDLRAKLKSAEVLAKGEHRLMFRAELPASLPPRYEGRLYRIGYLCEVHVDLPWWPDRRASFVLNVLPPDQHLPDETPFHFSTRPAGPRADELHLEGIVDQRTLVVGGVLAGSVVLSNLGLGYRELQVSLVAMERVSGNSYEAKRWTLSLPVPTAEGEPVPFRMRVPDVAPSFLAPSGGLTWKLEVAARTRMSQLKAPIPIRVVAAGPNAEARKVAPALPRIGNERTTQLWKQVADRHGFVLRGDGMETRRDDVRVRVSRDARGRDGMFLVADFEYDPLGLELLAHPRSELGKTVQAVINKDDPLRDLDVHGREDPQARAFVGRWWAPEHDLRVELIDDERARFVRPGAGQEERELDAFVRTVGLMVRAFFAARTQMPLPGPLLGADVAWAKLVTGLEQATLWRGPLAVTGELDGVPVRLGHEWEDAGPHVVAEMPSEQPLEPCFVVEDAAQVDALDLSAEARGVVLRLLEIGALEVETRTLRLRWPPGPRKEIDEGLTALRRLARLKGALRTNLGPYR